MKLQLLLLLFCTALSTSTSTTNENRSLKKLWIENFKKQQNEEFLSSNAENHSQSTEGFTGTSQPANVTTDIPSNMRKSHLPIPSSLEKHPGLAVSSTLEKTHKYAPFQDVSGYGISKETSEKPNIINPLYISAPSSTFQMIQSANSSEMEQQISREKFQPKTTKRNNSDSHSKLNGALSLSKRYKLTSEKATKRPNSSAIHFIFSDQGSNISQSTSELKYHSSKSGEIIYEFSHGILSWSRVGTETGWKFITKFDFTRISKRLYIGTNSYESIIIFKYACESVNFFGISEKKFKTEITESIFELTEEIFKVIYSLNLSLRPSLYLFGYTMKESPYMVQSLRIPLYFLFTSISRLIENGKSCIFQPLKSLIQTAYYRLKKSNCFQSEDWNILNEFVVNGDPNRPQIVVENEKYKPCRYDITTVNFIYHQMKKSENQEVRDFFIKVWDIYKKEKKKWNHQKTICTKPSLIVSIEANNNLATFEKAVRKLYQIEFTEFLFGKWNSLGSLIEKYLELKEDFSPYAVDFRMRVFGRKDFITLKEATIKIESALEKYYNSFPINLSLVDQSNIRCFFIELINFIRLKCVIFTYDYQNEPERKFNYEATFSDIEEIISISKGIIKILSSNGIKIEEHLILSINQLDYRKPIDLSILCNVFLNSKKK